MTTTFGELTPAAKVYKKEVHKLHQAFNVKAGETIYKTQPVKLHTDGTITAFTSSDLPHLCIGFVIDNAMGDNAPVSGIAEQRTVAMKAYAVVNAMCKADSQVPGPVLFDSFNTIEKLTVVDDASVDATNVYGWALEAGDEDDVIKVAITV